MGEYQLVGRQKRAERLALGGLRMILAVGFGVLGCGSAALLGTLVIWGTASCLPPGEAPNPLGRSLLTLALLIVTACYRLRRRADDACWRAMLDRYACGDETNR